MLSGRDTLGHLSTTLQSARSELQRLERELQRASSSVATNRQEQAQLIKRLAGMRLDSVLQGEVTQRIDSADHSVREILNRRAETISELNERTENADRALDSLEKRREQQHQLVEDAAEKLAEREAAAQNSLEQNPTFHTLLERTRETDTMAVSASEKAELAREDRRLKGQPYESDEFFMYLWNRHYGTSEYSANLFARMLDAWIARLCRFRDARANYWMLLEIPRRLQSHAEYVREVADLALLELQTLEQVAANDAGVTDARTLLAESERQQDDIDEKIAQSETAIRELQSEQNQFAAGTDRFIVECLSILSDAIERREISDLTRLARGTMTVEDDEIIADLVALRRKNSKFENELRHNQELHQEYLSRVQELEQVRQRFKHARYDDLRSEFDNGDRIVTMMRDVLVGAIRGGAFVGSDARLSALSRCRRCVA